MLSDSRGNLFNTLKQYYLYVPVRHSIVGTIDCVRGFSDLRVAQIQRSPRPQIRNSDRKDMGKICGIEARRHDRIQPHHEDPEPRKRRERNAPATGEAKGSHEKTHRGAGEVDVWKE